MEKSEWRFWPTQYYFDFTEKETALGNLIKAKPHMQNLEQFWIWQIFTPEPKYSSQFYYNCQIMLLHS